MRNLSNVQIHCENNFSPHKFALLGSFELQGRTINIWERVFRQRGGSCDVLEEHSASQGMEFFDRSEGVLASGKDMQGWEEVFRVMGQSFEVVRKDIRQSRTEDIQCLGRYFSTTLGEGVVHPGRTFRVREEVFQQLGGSFGVW